MSFKSKLVFNTIAAKKIAGLSFALVLGFGIGTVIQKLTLYPIINIDAESSVYIEDNTKRSELFKGFDDAEISLAQYEMLLKKQKSLDSLLFNQNVSKAMGDQIITRIEYLHLNNIYRDILKERKESSLDKYHIDDYSEKDRLNSIKKEINLHNESQNNNLI